MRKFWIAISISALAIFSAAQQPQGSQQQQQQQQQAPSLLNGPQQQQPANPQAQQAPAQPAPAQPGQQQGPPASGRKVQAKSKPEFDAFQTADATVASDADLAKGEAAAADFQNKFPQSELISILYDKLMKRYQQANNADKAVEMGRKELQFDPQSLPALLTVASIEAQITHDTDVDYGQKYDEVIKDANAALQMLNNPATAPAGITPEQVNSLKSLAYGAIGNIEFIRAGAQNATPAEKQQHDAAAEQALTQSTQLAGATPDPGEWLRLAVTLDHQQKYTEALAAADKAVQFAASEPNILTLAQQEQARLRALAKPGAPQAQTPAPKPH